MHVQQLRSPVPARTRVRRRGMIYILVLGVASMIAVVGIGAVMLSRSQIRTTAAARDWSEAGAAAQGGVEFAVAGMNSSATWRSDAKNLTAIGPLAIGKARVLLYIADEVDGDLANKWAESVRIYSVATCGGATRAYSVVAAPAGNIGLDALRCAVHAAGTLTTSGAMAAAGGPISCATSMTNSATITADVETNTLSSSGYVNGIVKTGVPAKAMPDSAAWTRYASGATTIPWSSIAGGTIDRRVLSAGVNSIGGGVNPNGVYAISVPLSSTLTIMRSRLQATLLITLGASAALVVRDENLWEPGTSSQPAMILQGGSLSSVTLGGSNSGSSLSEATHGVNFNPAGAPYAGVTNSNTSDIYPSELRGVLHILNERPVIITSNLRTFGTVLAAGNVTINSAAVLTANPALMTSPPGGYEAASGSKMKIVAGTFRWEVSDINGITAGATMPTMP